MVRRLNPQNLLKLIAIREKRQRWFPSFYFGAVGCIVTEVGVSLSKEWLKKLIDELSTCF